VSGTVIPNVPPQFFDNNGAVAAGYKLFIYSAGTTTKINTYSDAALATPNTNPIVLDSAGRATIFLDARSYKFVLAPPTDTDPPSSPIWTRDNVLALAAFNVNVDVQGTAGEALLTNDCVYLSAGDGGRTAGRWYRTDTSNNYTSVSAHSIGFVVTGITSGASGAIRIIGRLEGFSGLTAGALQYVGVLGQITGTKDAIFPRVIGHADSTTSLVVSEWMPQPLARINIYTSTGGNTWNKFPDASEVSGVLIGAGGGGASGRRGAAGTDRFGGGAGAGGGYTSFKIPASVVGSTESVTVGLGGAGGTGIGADNTDGNNGTAGGSTTFGAWAIAPGGNAGSAGTAANGQGGTSNTTQGMFFNGAGGGGQNGLGSNGGFGYHYAAGGGGGGGGINVANANGNGGNGGQGSISRNSTLSGGTGGVVAGANATVGTSASTSEGSGGGGGGGGGATSGTFNVGKTGGNYGGGGGGGGAVINGTAGGAGGAGANGIAIIIQV